MLILSRLESQYPEFVDQFLFFYSRLMPVFVESTLTQTVKQFSVFACGSKVLPGLILIAAQLADLYYLFAKRTFQTVDTRIAFKNVTDIHLALLLLFQFIYNVVTMLGSTLCLFFLFRSLPSQLRQCLLALFFYPPAMA
jgi:hypothetical protein